MAIIAFTHHVIPYAVAHCQATSLNQLDHIMTCHVIKCHHVKLKIHCLTSQNKPDIWQRHRVSHGVFIYQGVTMMWRRLLTSSPNLSSVVHLLKNPNSL